jgi:subtilisin-like proprotein convertase family protein
LSFRRLNILPNSQSIYLGLYNPSIHLFIFLKISMKASIFTCLLSFLAASGTAQRALNFFVPVSEMQVTLAETNKRILIPTHFQTFKLDYEGLKTALTDAPMEFTAAARAKKLQIEFPQADGSMETFAICESPVMHPDLMVKYPSIRTYSGISTTNASKTIRFTISPRGLKSHTYRADTGVDYVEPYAFGQTQFYMAYDRVDYPAELRLNLPVINLDEANEVKDDEDRFVPIDASEDRGSAIVPVNLKKYRYAVTCTGEFAQDNGGTKELVLAKIVEVNNQLSGIFERDIHVRLQLIALEDALIFLDPNSDPFSGDEVGFYLDQNPGVLNSIISLAGYDLGHNYCRYLGGSAAGVAGGNACSNGKGRGSSSGNGDYGDYFISVVGQEVGHQMSGGHTWNRCGGGGGRVGNTAYEPGSGTTIMSYAGSCGSDNVQGYSDLYFHTGSVEEIVYFYENGPGNNCGSTTATDNNHPEVTLTYQDNFFIPIKTAFELNGSATDPDGDALSYCWEQMDTGPERPLEAPQGNSPLFRTILPKPTTNRYFPKLSRILSNTSDLDEQLPTYTRDLTFRLTARDNRANGGGIHWKDVAFKSTSLAGPFLVSSPNLASDIWRVGEYAHVTWEVANTDKAPVNCLKVNILLSTDGGNTWPITLVSDVLNDGSQYVLVPNNVSNTARVRINASENIFFDVSNTNFKIQQPTTPSLTLGLETDGGQICLPATFETNVLSAAVLGFNSTMQLSVSGLPIGATASLGSNTINAGQNTSLKIDLTEVNTEGTYSIELIGISGTDTLHRPITLTTVSNDFTDLMLQLPLDGSTGMGQAQILYWNKSVNGNTHDLEFGTNAAFTSGSIVISKMNLVVDSFKITNQLEKSTPYFWRVRPVNECGVHAWSEPFFFSTLVDACSVAEGTDVPKQITTNGTPTIETKLFINTPGTVNAVTVKQIAGSHSAFKQLEATLISPAGTEVLLFKNKCGTISAAFNFGFDDNVPLSFQCPPSNSGQSVKPTQALSQLNGQSITGAWTLRIKDNELGSGGDITGFKLEFCSSVSLNPPYLVNNNTMQIMPGTNLAVSPDLLLVEDANNTHGQLTYTLLSVPQFGRLQLNGSEIFQGTQFKQADLDNGNMRFYDYGFSGALDGFRFIVTDGEGGYLGTTKFAIQPFPVGTNENIAKIGFTLVPNPTSNRVALNFAQPTLTDAQIFVYNMSGQLLQNSSINAGATQADLDVSTLVSGVYMVNVKMESGVVTKKLVVQK